MTAGFERPSWQALNAYVDGELPADEVRRVEAAAAADPAVAAALADLDRARRATRVLLRAELADAPAPAAPQGAHARRSWIGGKGWAVAAAVPLLIAALVLWRWDGIDEAREAWLAEAQERYAAQAVTVAQGELALLPAAVREQAAAFDLATAGLALVQAEGTEGGIYLGYQGSRGCRLGLWIAAAPAGLDNELRESLRDGLLVATWRSGERGYALLSQDMDPRRFNGIARLLAARTRAEHQVAATDAETLTLPCVG